MCEEEDSSLDYDGYEKSLDKLVTMSEKEYYVHLVDINRHQVIVAKTLLWLSIVLIGFDIGFMEWAYSKAKDSADLIPFLVPCYIFVAISIFASVISFGFSVFAIPAFGGYEPLYDDSWADFAGTAHENLIGENDSVYEGTLNALLARLDKACATGNETNGARGFKLRVASIASIVSASSIAISFIIFSFNYYL